MGNINLYKIDEEKKQLFLQELTTKMKLIDTMFLDNNFTETKKDSYGFSLYISIPDTNKELSWKWVLDEFHQPGIEIAAAAKGIIIIESENELTYAVTFGHSYFLVDKYCDRDFGFDFARKLDYQEIKTTTLTTPNSHRNKTVNTYVNYSELEFDSGESFAKLKAKVDLDKDFSLFKPSIEIGSSIRFSTAEESLQQVMNLILYVENVLKNENDKYHIPVFSKVNDNAKIALLEANLKSAVNENPAQVNISELDIIGVTEVFNHNDSEFVLSYRGIKKQIFSLTNEEIEVFCKDNNWNFCQTILDICVISLYNGEPVVTKSVKDLIDFTDDKEKCLLSKGIWYQYNDDYLSYLRDSVAEIDVEYNSIYDFSSELHKNYIEQKYIEEKDDVKYSGKSSDEIKKDLKRKYYAERAYNLIREQENGFTNYDRDESRVGNTKIEVMDLYKENMMCAVKIGNASSKLCYAVDQSLTALKLLKKGMLTNVPAISTVVLWIILEKHKHIEDKSGKPQLDQLDMLMLMNRLDQWKKEVRLQGFKPLIYINYRTD